MKEKNNNLLGILGAVLGAFIGAIPWILGKFNVFFFSICNSTNSF